MVEYPLTRAHRVILARAFSRVPRVDLSIDCALENQMGRAFVDDARTPSAFMISVGPFLYFAGDANGSAGQAMLMGIQSFNLVMPSASGWLQAARQIFGERLAFMERYGFSSQGLSIEHLDALIHASPCVKLASRMDLAFAEQIYGHDHFVELSDFESPQDFIDRGIGFHIVDQGVSVAAAFSSLVCSKGIEVSVYVLPACRRQGMATVLAALLLKWCLAQGMDAHWDAANPESCRLAEKLGYKPIGSYQAYYLKD